MNRTKLSLITDAADSRICIKQIPHNPLVKVGKFVLYAGSFLNLLTIVQFYKLPVAYTKI